MKRGQAALLMALLAMVPAPLLLGLSFQTPTSLSLAYATRATSLHPGPAFSRSAWI